jgi:hypothetical protein
MVCERNARVYNNLTTFKSMHGLNAIELLQSFRKRWKLLSKVGMKHNINSKIVNYDMLQVIGEREAWN